MSALILHLSTAHQYFSLWAPLRSLARPAKTAETAKSFIGGFREALGVEVQKNSCRYQHEAKAKGNGSVRQCVIYCGSGCDDLDK